MWRTVRISDPGDAAAYAPLVPQVSRSERVDEAGGTGCPGLRMLG